MSPEFWAIMGVGVALTAVGVTAVTLGWSMYARLDARLTAVDARLPPSKKAKPASRDGLPDGSEKKRPRRTERAEAGVRRDRPVQRLYSSFPAKAGIH